jgi:hypothetical protein
LPTKATQIEYLICEQKNLPTKATQIYCTFVVQPRSEIFWNLPTKVSSIAC